MANYESQFFENLDLIRGLNIVTFRLLNFVLYSFLLGGYILQNLSKEEIQDYLIIGYTPDLFSVIRKNWELLDISLKEKGIENVQIFLNMIFDKIIEMINNLDFVDTKEKLQDFENNVNKYITDIISEKEIVEKINNSYKSINNELNT